MTNQQLYLAIGLPILFNLITAGVLLAYVQIGFAGLHRRMDDLRDLWRAELRRVEEVLDARLKHQEERPR